MSYCSVVTFCWKDETGHLRGKGKGAACCLAQNARTDSYRSHFHSFFFELIDIRGFIGGE